MRADAEHCSFVLLADFDIDRGAQLTYQFPQPLGTDEGCVTSITCVPLNPFRDSNTSLLANLMLPDGAERQAEDWTIFFLNQTVSNTIAPVLALDTPEIRASRIANEDGKPELMYVLNLVRTKLDKTVWRCVAVLFACCVGSEDVVEVLS